MYFKTDIKEGYEFEIIRQLSDREKAKSAIVSILEANDKEKQ